MSRSWSDIAWSVELTDAASDLLTGLRRQLVVL
jgi:hypothetical protein